MKINRIKKIFMLTDIWTILIELFIILIAINIMDELDITQYIFENSINKTITFGVVILFILCFIKNKTYNAWKCKFCNQIDIFNIISVICIIIYFFIIKPVYRYEIILEFIFEIKKKWIGINLPIYLIKINIETFRSKIYVCISILILISLCIRAYFTLNKREKRKKTFNKENNENRVSLNDLYRNNLPARKSMNELVIFDDNETKEDLLNRSEFIDQCINIIESNNKKNGFVMSLEGKWGCGKSSIVEMIENKLEKERYIIIKDFNPWLYKNEKEMITEMFKKFLRKIGEEYHFIDIEEITSSYIDTIFGNNKYLKFIKGLFKINSKSEMKRKYINSCISQSGKTLIFVIDNIERIEKNNIIVLFNSVANYLHFDNTINLLVFDNSKIKKIFENDLNIDYEYLKKIISIELFVPEVKKESIYNVKNTCINNLCNYYGIKNIDHTQIKMICNNTGDIRDFIRYINSVISIISNSYLMLNIVYVSFLEIIKMEDWNLYEYIKDNKHLFISDGINKYRDINNNELDDYKLVDYNKKEYDKHLNNIKESHKEMLRIMFPFVDRYFKNKSLANEKDIEYSLMKDEKIKNKEISHSYFFDAYFERKTNSNIELQEKIKYIIKCINNKNYNSEALKNEFKVLFSNSDICKVVRFIGAYVYEIGENIVLYILGIIYEYIQDESYEYQYYELTNEFKVIFKKILGSKSIKEDIVVDYFNKQLSNFEQTQFLMYLYQNTISKKYNVKLYSILKNKKNEIINKEIRIYLHENYKSGIWLFVFQIFNIFEGSPDFNEYANEYLNEYNIFDFIEDFIIKRHCCNRRFIYFEGLLKETNVHIYNILNKIKRDLSIEEKNIRKIFMQGFDVDKKIFKS